MESESGSESNRPRSQSPVFLNEAPRGVSDWAQEKAVLRSYFVEGAFSVLAAAFSDFSGLGFSIFSSPLGAAAALSESVAIYTQYLGSDHPCTHGARRNLERVKRKMGET